MGYYGIHVHEKAIEYGVKLSGATVHFVEADVDGGAIIMQRAVPVEPDDTPETLQARILKEEHKMLPECVKLLCQGKVQKEGRRVFIRR
jgi:phosphoribosylglycinamide formyltransferase-1